MENYIARLGDNFINEEIKRGEIDKNYNIKYELEEDSYSSISDGISDQISIFDFDEYDFNIFIEDGDE